MATLHSLRKKLLHHPFCIQRSVELLKQYNSGDWRRYIDTNDRKNMVFSSPSVKMSIFTWNPGEVSPIYPHFYSNVIKILHNKLMMTCYDINGEEESYNTLKKGYITSDNKIHMLQNTSEDICVSLHIYEKD